MKKILIALTIVISCLGISKVSADTLNFTYSDVHETSCDFYYVDYDYVKTLGYENQMQEIYNMLITSYNSNYSEQYPYYYIHFVVKDKNNCNQASEASSVGYIAGLLNLYSDIPSLPLNAGERILFASYDVIDKIYNTPQETTSYYYPWLFDDGYYNPLSYFVSNFDLVNNTTDNYNITGNSNFTINPGDVIKPYYSAGNAFQIDYTEINLNDYAYVALALKDYSKKAFETTIQVKGQYCLTPVYNYGMTERKDILTGTQVDRCSPYYDNYTPIRTYILDNDLKNNAIYYLKSYDTTRDNFVKVDTSVFDITYITEENKDNPYVTIGGKTYPTIPYDNLTDTAIKSEDEGYVSGAVEEFSFADIFTAPLDFLMEIWGTIVTFFDLITSFIALLPAVLQNFLYASFMLAIVLGLIKIIL